MACEYICDACKKREPAEDYNGRWFKPPAWYERSDDRGIQTACSRECVDRVAKESGKTKVILPV